MPSLGADMETGKVVQWLVQPGSRVKSGDVVAVVETHKGAIDVEIFLDGVIDNLAPIGQELKVGAVLAQVQAPGEPAPSTAPAGTARAKVSPAARRRAHELGVDADRLHGTGTDGSVTLADVEKAGSEAPLAMAAQTPSAPAPPAPVAAVRPKTGFDATLMRRAIAAAMSRSKREIPHYYLTTTIDFAAAGGWLASYNRDRAPEERLLPAALLLKATARALVEVPQLNGFYEKDAFRAAGGIHLGWALARRGGGLVAPAIHDADRKALPELMVALRGLVQRARAGGLRSSELTDPTVTVTSAGDRGAESVLGVIYPPQVAIVGFGRVVERPWAVQGRIETRPVVIASLAADHRASDGHVGGLLLAAIDRALQQPDRL